MPKYRKPSPQRRQCAMRYNSQYLAMTEMTSKDTSSKEHLKVTDLLQAHKERRKFVEQNYSHLMSRSEASFCIDLLTWMRFWPDLPFSDLGWPQETGEPRSKRERAGEIYMYKLFREHFGDGLSMDGPSPDRRPQKKKARPEKRERDRIEKAERLARQAQQNALTYSTEPRDEDGLGEDSRLGTRGKDEETMAEASGNYEDEGLSEAMDISEPESDSDAVLIEKTADDMQVGEGDLLTAPMEIGRRFNVKRGLKRSQPRAAAAKRLAKQAQSIKALLSSIQPGADHVSGHEIDGTDAQSLGANTKDPGMAEDVEGLSEDMDISDPELDDDNQVSGEMVAEGTQVVDCELCGWNGHIAESCLEQCPNWRCFQDLHRAVDCPLRY